MDCFVGPLARLAMTTDIYILTTYLSFEVILSSDLEVTMNPLLKTSAISLAKKILEKKETAEDVVKTYITQAKKVNPALNAIVKDRYDLALNEAKKVDLNGDKPLLGVPCSIKELFAVEGLPQTAGLVYRKYDISKEDATIVSRIKAAGAIPIGVTNVPALALHYESRNKIYGQTNNPYNLAHIPGGSSGGEGAIISAAGSAFGLGSDIGGSIRMPAFFCGIFGHKPSSGLVSTTGHFPYFEDIRARRYLGLGPMTRYAQDLMPILKVIAGPDGIDDSVEKMKLGDEKKVKISDLTFYYINHKNLHRDVKRAQDNAIHALKSSGATVQEIPLGKFKYAFDIWLSSIVTVIPSSKFRDLLGGGKKIHSLRELFKEMFGKSDYPFYIILNMLIGSVTDHVGKGRAKKFFEMGELFRQEVNELLGKNGVLIYPTHPYPAVKHGRAALYLTRVGFTGIFNILHTPATAIPMGFSEEGLPVGIQAVARKGNDHLTIAVACYLEDQGFGWIPPKLAE